VDINVPIAYTANLMKAMQLMDTVAWEMHQDAQWQDMILEPPQLMGADDFGDQGVIVKLWIKTRPLEQWKVAREYRPPLEISLRRGRYSPTSTATGAVGKITTGTLGGKVGKLLLNLRDNLLGNEAI
jgi:hypothetical protein